MSIISTVGRRSTGVRILIAFIYIVLAIGSITMVYPFLLMLACSVSSSVDFDDHLVIPRYIYNNNSLFLKYINDRYGYFFDTGGRNIANLNYCYRTEFIKYQDLKITPVDTGSPHIIARVEDWEDFMKTLPDEYWQRALEITVTGLYHDYLREKFSGDIKALNSLYAEENEYFSGIVLPFEAYLKRSWEPDDNPKWKDWRAFRNNLPLDCRMVVSSEMGYPEFLKRKYREITGLNEVYSARYKSFSEIYLPAQIPSHEEERKDWEEFVRTKFPYRYLVLTGGDNEYQSFLRERYKEIGRVNKEYGRNFSDFTQIPLSGKQPLHPIEARDWKQFICQKIPLEYIKTDSAEERYRAFIREKHGTLAQINRIYGTEYQNFSSVKLPYYEYDYFRFSRNTAKTRLNFLTRNYIHVIDFMAVHGRATLNTLLLVIGTIIGQLTIGPLCAYALSRYRFPYTYKILLFFLATMAFPAEVSMIPSFLLLKNFHLLNTYWALILPGLANGFFIFLLKGFFDSLPEELYEAATIDGASEMRMFFQITIPLCKPIFAVIALQAFTSAYGGFMWAFIVCQNPKWWTIMVYLYQFQQFNPQYMIMAALTLASIPTLIVFLLAQRVILRGIIIPVMK